VGFNLHGLMVLEEAGVAVFDRVFPGAGTAALPIPDSWTDGECDLPCGWVVPRENMLDEISPAPGWYEPVDDAAWRERLGVPDELFRTTRFEVSDMRLAALLSVVAPRGCVLLLDETFGGVLGDEEAVAFLHGRYVAHGPSIGPVAAHLDPRYAKAFLFDGYFPRQSDSGLYRPRSGRHHWGDVSVPVPDGPWRTWFPILEDD
jgi:hypothetical protein